MATPTLPDSDPPEPDYREVRRYVLTLGHPVAPADLMREYRVGWNRANRLLEELEADHVLRSYASAGRRLWTPSDVTPDPDRPLPSTLRVARHYRRGSRSERCAVCDWFIPPALGATDCRGVHRHHIVPLCCGGADEPANLVELCPNHHALVHILWTRSGGLYSGPTSRVALIETVRFVEADPEEFARLRRLDAVATLDVRARHRKPKPPPRPPSATPPLRAKTVTAPPPPPAPRSAKRWRLTNPTPKHIQHHISHHHRGPIFDCSLCAEECKGDLRHAPDKGSVDM